MTATINLGVVLKSTVNYYSQVQSASLHQLEKSPPREKHVRRQETDSERNLGVFLSVSNFKLNVRRLGTVTTRQSSHRTVTVSKVGQSIHQLTVTTA